MDEVFCVRVSVKAAVANLTSCLLAGTFTAPADTMVTDFDVPGFLHMLTGRAVRLLAASAAGVVLASLRGELQVATGLHRRSRAD